jgi:hypothetical protein
MKAIVFEERESEETDSWPDGAGVYAWRDDEYAEERQDGREEREGEETDTRPKRSTGAMDHLPFYRYGNKTAAGAGYGQGVKEVID